MSGGWRGWEIGAMGRAWCHLVRRLGQRPAAGGLSVGLKIVGRKADGHSARSLARWVTVINAEKLRERWERRRGERILTQRTRSTQRREDGEELFIYKMEMKSEGEGAAAAA